MKGCGSGFSTPLFFTPIGAKFIPLFVPRGEPLASAYKRSSFPIVNDCARTYKDIHFDRVPFRDDEKSHISGRSHLCDLAHGILIFWAFVDQRFSYAKSLVSHMHSKRLFGNFEHSTFIRSLSRGLSGRAESRFVRSSGVETSLFTIFRFVIGM